MSAELPALAAAIRDDDAAAIAGSLAVVAPRTATAFSRVQALGDRVSGAFGTDLSPFDDDVRDLITRCPSGSSHGSSSCTLSAPSKLHAPLALLGIVDSVEVPGTVR